MVIIFHGRVESFQSIRKQQDFEADHFPLGSQGRYLRGPLDLITIYERDSTDLRTSGDPRVIRKANWCCRRRLFSRSIHNYRYFFLRTRITESRFSIDKKEKRRREKEKKNKLAHIDKSGLPR